MVTINLDKIRTQIEKKTQDKLISAIIDKTFAMKMELIGRGDFTNIGILNEYRNEIIKELRKNIDERVI